MHKRRSRTAVSAENLGRNLSRKKEAFYYLIYSILFLRARFLYRGRFSRSQVSSVLTQVPRTARVLIISIPPPPAPHLWRSDQRCWRHNDWRKRQKTAENSPSLGTHISRPAPRRTSQSRRVRRRRHATSPARWSSAQAAERRRGRPSPAEPGQV